MYIYTVTLAVLSVGGHVPVVPTPAFPHRTSFKMAEKSAVIAPAGNQSQHSEGLLPILVILGCDVRPCCKRHKAKLLGSTA